MKKYLEEPWITGLSIFFLGLSINLLILIIDNFISKSTSYVPIGAYIVAASLARMHVNESKRKLERQYKMKTVLPYMLLTFILFLFVILLFGNNSSVMLIPIAAVASIGDGIVVYGVLTFASKLALRKVSTSRK